MPTVQDIFNEIESLSIPAREGLVDSSNNIVKYFDDRGFILSTDDAHKIKQILEGEHVEDSVKEKLFAQDLKTIPRAGDKEKLQ